MEYQLMQPHIITETGCFTVFWRQSGWYSSPDFCRTKLLPSLWNKWNCDSSDHITFFHWSMIQSLWSLAHWSLAVIIFAVRNGFFLGLLALYLNLQTSSYEGSWYIDTPRDEICSKFCRWCPPVSPNFIHQHSLISLSKLSWSPTFLFWRCSTTIW